MSDSEEDEIFIQFEEQIKSLKKNEANSAIKVKDQFDLGHEPACVFKSGKRVEFGHLEVGKKYKLEGGEKIPNQKQHLQNAVMISMAIYEESGPTGFLESSSTYHTLKTVCAISVNSRQGVMLAVGEVEGKNTLYVSYRGTATWEDALDDADIELTRNNTIPGGRFHSGFNKRSETVSIEQILHCAIKEQCQTIISCGHSLGGAVSSITAIKLMQQIGKESEISVHNITFGAPFFANEHIRVTCKEERLDRHMLHYVGHEDIIPGILSVGHTAQMAHLACNAATGGFYDVCRTFLSKAGKIASFVLGNIPWGKSDIKSEAHILCDLMAKILNGPKGTTLGQDYSPFEYVPIGNFYVIEKDKVSLIASGSVTPQIQELVLKEPIRRINSLDAIRNGHSLGDYYCASLKLFNKLEPVPKRKLTQTNLLCPLQEGSASIILKSEDEDKSKCTLIVMGSFLENSHIESNALIFRDTNEMECSHESLVVSGIITNLEEENLASLELQLSTPFGKIPIKMGIPKTSNFKNIPNILSEPVSVVIEKSILRCLRLSALNDGEPKDSKKKAENDMRTKLESLVNLLEPEDLAGFQSLCRDVNPFKQKEKINSLVKTILAGITKDIKLYYKKKRYQFTIPTISLKDTVLVKVAKWLRIGVLSALQFGFDLFPSLRIIQEVAIEEDYNKQLATILKLILNDPALKLACIADQHVLELMGRTRDELTKNDEYAFVGERIITFLQLQGKKRMFSNLEELFLDLLDASKLAVQSKMNVFCSVHDIRMLYSKQCFIGFVGPQNAGKSTLINCLFGRTAEVGMRNHTLEPTRYEVAENIFAIDFPGSDSLEDHCERFKEYGFMNNFFVYVMPYNGTPSKSLVANVRSAYKIERISGKASKTIFCINKSAVGNEVFDDNYKTQFVKKIKDGIECNDYDEEDSILKDVLKGFKEKKETKQLVEDAYKEIEARNTELKAYALRVINEKDFLFTDWETEASNRGIKGPDEVRRKIKQYLRDSQIQDFCDSIPFSGTDCQLFT